MINRNGTNDDAIRRFDSIVNGNNGGGVSSQVLLCIKALHDAHLTPVNFDDVVAEPTNEEVFLKLLDMLRDEELLTGPNEKALLTTKGFKSLKISEGKDYRVAQFLNNGQPVLKQYDPNKLLISILRSHFEEWQDK